MPLPEDSRVRVKTFPSGKKVRLAFKKGTNQVIEAKNIAIGATHTPREFAQENIAKRMVAGKQKLATGKQRIRQGLATGRQRVAAGKQRLAQRTAQMKALRSKIKT
jgi:hypothetical protein